MSHTNLGLCILSILIYVKLVLHDSCEVSGERAFSRSMNLRLQSGRADITQKEEQG